MGLGIITGISPELGSRLVLRPEQEMELEIESKQGHEPRLGVLSMSGI